jgi:leucyl-tRNA synthetase
LPIQENGKFRHTIIVNDTMSEDEVIQRAKNEVKVINFINKRPIKKIIYVKNKILNFII